MMEKVKGWSEKEVRQYRWRVTCLNPILDIQGGAIELQSKMHRLCGHGIGMTIEEMNENLLWKGKPYIKIPYCKYCYTENTIGVFDDLPQLVGWAIHSPDQECPYFTLEKLTEEAFDRVLRRFEKYGRI